MALEKTLKIVVASWDKIYRQTVRDVKKRKPQKEDRIIYVENADAAWDAVAKECAKLAAWRKAHPKAKPRRVVLDVPI